MNVRLTAAAACLLLLSGQLHAATVTINKASHHQTMVGFGTHTNIKAWKYKVGPFYYTADLDSAGFYDSLARDMNVFRTSMRSGANEHIRALVARGMQHFIMTSWSPPADMKTNGETCCGGNLLTDKYDDYATYCVNEINAFKTGCGVDLLAFNFQNEPAFYEPYNSCIFDPIPYKNMHVELGRLAQTQGVLAHTMLMGPECMATYTRGDGVRNYTDPILSDAEAKGFLGALAVHGYKDGVEPDYGSAAGWTQIAARAAQLGVPCWQTETDMPCTTMSQAISMAGAIYVGVKFGDLSVFSKWTCANESDNHMVWNGVYYPGYYALAHFGRYVRDGAVRVDCESNDTTVLSVAFEDQARGWFTVVLINIATASRTVSIAGSGLPSEYRGFQTTDGAKGVELVTQNPSSITLPAKSITTLYAGVSTGVAPTSTYLRAAPVSRTNPCTFDLLGRPSMVLVRRMAPGVYVGQTSSRASELTIPR